MLRIHFGLLFIVLSMVKGEWVDSEAIWQTIWDKSYTCQYNEDTNWIHHITLDKCKKFCLEIKRCNAVQFRSSSRLRQVVNDHCQRQRVKCPNEGGLAVFSISVGPSDF